jgi:hypothetical protein
MEFGKHRSRSNRPQVPDTNIGGGGLTVFRSGTNIHYSDLGGWSCSRILAAAGGSDDATFAACNPDRVGPDRKLGAELRGHLLARRPQD